MKVVLAPDSFKESMSAAEAAAAMARGVRAVYADAECVEVPMADGGEGTAEALVDALGGQWREVATVDALGRPITARYGLTPDGLAVIEVAAAVGIGLIPPAEREVMASSSAGVADLVRDALDAGATHVIVGLGGSATTDGGAGLLAGLGAVWLDADGVALAAHPEALTRLDRVDLTGLDPRLERVEIELACDVTNPLLGPSGSAAVFGPQKGASPEQVPVLDGVLTRIADALVAAGRADVREVPGAGAAGGLGAAFLSLGGRRRRGVEVVAEAAGLARHVAGVDLVLTGEGSIDSQTLAGKTPAGVAEVAAASGAPVIAFAGRLGEGAEELVGNGFAAVVSITTGPCDLATALADGPANLERAVATALRLYRLGATR
ncbi:glycerate kinase [Micropruina sonneratiae]|uniref:glycerate kinase n=1 Tax=Micropruina sonneratiae TaxID=2986940 RepID=UPI002225CCB9|nr:glycerate kinase [Micropruina sp. KQZ13P-5]MCW3159064.1 glycerate kinase [Micropruina sp. KQZ13P-5]